MTNRNPEKDYSSPYQFWQFQWQQHIKNLHTAMPGHIVSYNAVNKRATVLPALRVVKVDLSERFMPPIPDVPVLQPSGGGWNVLFPLKENDPVMLLFSERGIQLFKVGYRNSTPDEGPMFSPRDAVAIPSFGLRRVTPVDPDGLCIQSDDGTTSIVLKDASIELKVGSNVLRLSSSGLTYNGNTVRTL